MDYRIRVGDRVQTKSYGAGTVVEIDDPARGTTIYWIKLDDPRYLNYGTYKTVGENLQKIHKEG